MTYMMTPTMSMPEVAFGGMFSNSAKGRSPLRYSLDHRAGSYTNSPRT
jgi:hypothetical protein